MKKILILIFPAFIVGAYTAFVAMCYWNWFVVTALNITQISYIEMLGIVWLIGLLNDRSNDPNEVKWKVLLTTLDHIVPEDKKEAVYQAVKDMEDNLWVDLSAKISGVFIGNTIALILGFILHLFI